MDFFTNKHLSCPTCPTCPIVPPTPSPPSDYVPLDWKSVGIAASLLLIDVFIIWVLKLEGLSKTLVVAAIRCFVQLFVLGAVLQPIFSLHNPLFVSLFVFWMIFAATMEVNYSRSKYRFVGEWWLVCVSLALATSLIGTLGVGVAMKSDPIWSPRTLIPTVGMLLGNSMTAISLALGKLLTDLAENQARIEYLLSLGASRTEAAQNVASEAIRTGLVPTLNGMSIMGLVSIPGMMTGQILGGTPPQEAVKYQQVIMFCMAASVGLSVSLSVLFASLALFDGNHRLRSDRIDKVKKEDSGYIRGIVKDLKELFWSLRVHLGFIPKSEDPERRPLLDRYGSILATR